MTRKSTCLFIVIVWIVLISGCLYSSKRSKKIETEAAERYKQESTVLQSERDNLQTQLNEEQEKGKKKQTALESLRQRIIELEKQNAKLASKIIGVTPGPPVDQSKLIHCKIIEINAEANILILSISQQSGIFPNAELKVYRNDKMIGWLKIDMVEPDWSSAHSLRKEDLEKFQAGDKISVQLTK